MIVDIVRHGVTANNVAGRFNVGDEPLVTGEFERLRSAGLKPLHDQRLYVSPLRRCVETALALGFREYEIDARLGEREFGIFAGLTPEECRTRHRDAFEAFSRLDADFAAPGGESRAQHYARIASWLADASLADMPVLAVTHGGTIDFLYRLATGRPLHGGDCIYAGDNAAVSRFRMDGTKVELVSFSTSLVSGG